MIRCLLVLAAAVVLAPGLAGAAPEMPAPTNVVSIDVAGTAVTLWPYTFQEPAPLEDPEDPINLIFPDADPRQIRQALLALGGANMLGCVWTDAMGYEQAAWADAEGWTGSEVQLGCSAPGAPLGGPFRFHLRLFRQGRLTLGAAHFEFNIPKTAEHQVLGWDLARMFVIGELQRAQALAGGPTPVALRPAGTFRDVNRQIYDGLVATPAAALLAAAGLPVPPAPLPPAGQPIPMPTDGKAFVVPTNIAFAPVQQRIETSHDVTYAVAAPKPFCNPDGSLYVYLAGPVHMELRVHTNPSGMFSRMYVVTGLLMVKHLTGPDAGTVRPAVISEVHQALLTDHYGQVNQATSQVLMGDAPQSQVTLLRAGHVDEFSYTDTCDIEY